MSSGNWSGSDQLPGVRGESSRHLQTTGGRGGSDLSNMSSSAAWRSTNKEYGRGNNPREVGGGYRNRAFGMGRKKETFEDVEQMKRGEIDPERAFGMGREQRAHGMGRQDYLTRLGRRSVIADTTPEIERKKTIPTPPPSDSVTATTTKQAKRLG